jgi:tRNA (Thr-GGU) A37 N-methylase
MFVVFLGTCGCRAVDGLSGQDPAIRIDGERVSVSDLYPDEARPIVIRPIGWVENDKERGKGDFGITGSDVSKIHLYPGMARFMKGLADETSLLILWHFHKARPIRSVFRRGWDGKEVGPFASRTPDRPTPIGVTEVELVGVEGTTLTVRNLDAFNGTPVLDIKVSMASLRQGR